MVSFYLAGRYERRAELNQIAERMVCRGHRITSRWIGGAHEGTDGTEAGLTPEDSRRFATEDLQDIDAAQIVVLFTDGKPGRGGKDHEFGYAMAKGKFLVLVGPEINVFHRLDGILRFDDEAQFLDWTRRGGAV